MARRKNRQAKRRRGGGFFLTLLTVLIVTGAIAASITVFLKVAKFEVYGITRYSPAEIIDASGIQTGENMFAVNKFKVSSNILKSFPYIGQLKIARRFPDTFIFTIIERVPAGYMEAGDMLWLVASDGYLLESFSRENFNIILPLISGGELLAPSPGTKVSFDMTEKVRALSDILGALSKGKLTADVNSVDISKLYSLTFTYQNRLRVVLGDAEALANKIKLFNAVVKELDSTDKGTVTLSSSGEARFRPE